MYLNKQAPANTELLGPSRRFEQSLGGLNARIVRLATLLDAPIATADDRQRILDRQVPHFLRPDGVAAASGPARRLTRGWEELRGLIVLRYEILSNAASELGPQATIHLLLKVELELELGGFKHGASGFDLLSWLDN